MSILDIRRRFQEGGDIRNVIKEFEKEGTTPSSFAGPRGIEFKLTTGRFSGKPVYKPIYPKDYDFLKFGAIGGGGDVELDPDYFFKHIMAPEGTYFDIEKNDFLPVDSTPKVPTVDPFSGQQVSIQEQAAFTQPQDIFPQQELPTVQPEIFQPYQAEPSNVGIFSGPAYDTYSQARLDAYANAPSKFDYDVTANQAAGQFIQDKVKELLGDNIFSKGIGTLATAASVPIAFYSSPFHEAAQVIREGRMEPGSGIKGFYKALLNELPFETAANRAAGVLKSVPGVGESIYSGAYKLGEGLGNLTSNNPILNSLTKNFNNLSLQEMDKIRNTPKQQLIEQARSSGQNGGMGYLLGF